MVKLFSRFYADEFDVTLALLTILSAIKVSISAWRLFLCLYPCWNVSRTSFYAIPASICGIIEATPTPIFSAGRLILDRRVFAYRAVLSDEVLASVIVIGTLFSSVCFIGLFLGLESVLEGISAGQGVSSWVSEEVFSDR